MRRCFHYIFATLTLAVLTACTDFSYNGIAPDGSSDYYKEDPIPVLLRVGEPDDILTRGSGVVDYESDNPWYDKDIYVYAFKRDLKTTYTTTCIEDPIYCLIDATNDEIDSPKGKAGKVNSHDTYVTWTGVVRNVFYPDSNEPYDFFAYYLDDIEADNEDFTRSDDSITIDITIDGTQDVMSAAAALTESQLYGPDYTDEERLDIRNYAFSSFTAKKSIHPTFIFKHHLSRIRFSLYPQRPVADCVYVDSITVRSKTKGVFTVAHKTDSQMGIDFSADTVYKILPLTEEDGSPLRQNVYHPHYSVDYEGKDIYDRDCTMVGGSILAAPDENYVATIYLREEREGYEPDFYEHNLVLTAPSGRFKPGMQYEVRIAVYALMEIIPSVTAEPWVFGGNLFLDEDEIFENM